MEQKSGDGKSNQKTTTTMSGFLQSIHSKVHKLFTRYHSFKTFFLFKIQRPNSMHLSLQMPKCCHFMTVIDTSQSVKASVAGCSQSQGVTGFSVLQKSQFANLQRPQLIYSSFTDFQSLENGRSFFPKLQKPSWTLGTKSVRPWQCQ